MTTGMYTFQEAVQKCLPFLNDLKSHWQNQTEKVSEKSEKHTCFKGCGTCCHYGLISSSSIEAFGLLCGWLETGKTLESAHAAGMNYVEKFKTAIGKIGHVPFSRNAKVQFLRERIPCPVFISTTAPSNTDPALSPMSGHCGLFEHRPIICGQFHSTENPKLCAELKPHGTEKMVIEIGEIAGHSLRDFERRLFGKSALGHLPLLFAALTTKEGQEAFLRRDKLAEVSVEDPYAQETQDFFFYAELLNSLGIEMGEKDLLDLEKAQSEINPS